MGAQLEQTIHLISFLTSPVFLDNIFNEPTTFTSRWEKKNFILSTKDTLTKFGVPVVLENKFSCKFETWILFRYWTELTCLQNSDKSELKTMG